MSGLREQLTAQLARFDDDAFVALANRGLLRRAQKDLQSQPAVTIEETKDVLTLCIGEQRIRFDARGPAHAQCSCPASGICQHILVGALWLQRQSATESAPDNSVDPNPLAQLQSALMRMSTAELTKHAGKAGYRWAWQFVQDLEPKQGLRVSGEQHIVLAFSQPRLTFRYMGGAIDSIVADSAISQIEKYRVAAVLAYQRALGVAIALPEPAARPRTAALDLGKDHAGVESSPDSLRESRMRLRESAKQLFGECIELGLSHLSSAIYERYATLAVWAQGAEYFRLALLIRRLADHVEMLLERTGVADEHQLFDELTLAFGLVSALDHAAANGAAPVQLVGRARSQYEKSGKLELLGLGASAWRSASGYVGLTMMFWSPVDRAFFSCTDARPENQRAFNPAVRYKAAGPWSGLGAPQQATGHRVFLTGVQINNVGRLSAAEITTAAVRPLGNPRDFADQLTCCTVWRALRESQGLARRSLLAEPQPMKDWAVLRPTRFGAAQFDTNRQVMVWPLFDENDEQLNIELTYGDFTEHAITRIEQLSSHDLPSGTMVVARVRQSGEYITADPLSLVRVHPTQDENPIDALYFDPAPKQGIGSKFLSKMRRMARGEELTTVFAASSSLRNDAVHDFRIWLQRLAERGVPPEQFAQVDREIVVQMERCTAAGFEVFTRLNCEGKNPAAVILQANYLCMQYDRLNQERVDEIGRAARVGHSAGLRADQPQPRTRS